MLLNFVDPFLCISIDVSANNQLKIQFLGFVVLFF